MCLHDDAVPPRVLEVSISSTFKFQGYSMTVVRADTFYVGHYLQVIPFHLPCSQLVPVLVTLAVVRVVLEVSVLYELCVQSAVGAVVDVFKEDAHQFVADWLRLFAVDNDFCPQVFYLGKALFIIACQFAFAFCLRGSRHLIVLQRLQHRIWNA